VITNRYHSLQAAVFAYSIQSKCGDWTIIYLLLQDVASHVGGRETAGVVSLICDSLGKVGNEIKS